MDYRYTVDDPAVYTRPYTVMFELDKGNGGPPNPDLCHENNRDMGGVLANARADEQQSLENGIESVNMRKPRLEMIKKAAQEAASKQGSKR